MFEFAFEMILQEVEVNNKFFIDNIFECTVYTYMCFRAYFKEIHSLI